MQDYPPRIATFYTGTDAAPTPDPDTRSPLAFLRWILGMESRLVLRSTTLRKLTSEAGSMLMESLYRNWNQGDGSPFRIPASMTTT